MQGVTSQDRGHSLIYAAFLGLKLALCSSIYLSIHLSISIHPLPALPGLHNASTSSGHITGTSGLIVTNGSTDLAGTLTSEGSLILIIATLPLAIIVMLTHTRCFLPYTYT